MPATCRKPGQSCTIILLGLRSANMRWHFTPLLILAGLAAACSAPATDDADALATDPETGRYGLVVLTHEFAEPGVEVSGQLLDYSAPSLTDALHALAVPVEAWLTQARGPADCRVVAAPFEQRGHVDLLSAGTLRVSAPDPLDQAMTIEPTAFPSLRFSLSGVVYDAAAPEALPYLARGQYRVSAPGAEVGPIQAQVPSADPVWIKDVAQGADGLVVRWGGSGLAHLVLARDTPTRTIGVVCSSEDGEVLVDADLLRSVGPGGAQLVVARSTRTPTRIEGLDAAEILFVTRDTVHIDLGPAGSAEENEDR